MWKILEALKETNCKTQKTVVPEIKNAIYGMKYSLEKLELKLSLIIPCSYGVKK